MPCPGGKHREAGPMTATANLLQVRIRSKFETIAVRIQDTTPTRGLVSCSRLWRTWIRAGIESAVFDAMRILLLAQGWANCDRCAGGLSIVTFRPTLQLWLPAIDEYRYGRSCMDRDILTRSVFSWLLLSSSSWLLPPRCQHHPQQFGCDT